ncbi:hypothetical protein Y032_0278g1141 [Ancylostoma ceylanicum]|uniref:Uncharacterized protein n=1 Tax=Ancylostoma ceylanicum TaxID=53326 RepID=A0A016S6Z8_9BILA|nr:hypothetical protein Y032_0278g1141 [Ancylostoma ceylanicum]
MDEFARPQARRKRRENENVYQNELLSSSYYRQNTYLRVGKQCRTLNVVLEPSNDVFVEELPTKQSDSGSEGASMGNSSVDLGDRHSFVEQLIRAVFQRMSTSQMNMGGAGRSSA